MTSKLLDNYIHKLENSTQKIIGIWEQGSKVYGYNDQFSDEDYVVIWENKYPDKDERKKLLNDLNLFDVRLEDKSNKGQDYISLDSATSNIVHLSENDDFFELFNKINKESANEDQLYRIGGFLRGNIIYDPKNKLSTYKDSLKVTDKILNNYQNSRQIAIKNNIEWLNIAAKRKQPVECIKCLNFLLITNIVLQYLENREFPLPMKWYEHEAQRFGWNDSNVFKAVQSLKNAMPFEEIAKYFEKTNL